MGDASPPSVSDETPEVKPAARLQGLPLVVMATACWSTAGVFITSLVRDGGFTGFGLAFWRMVITSACLFAYLAVRHPAKLRVKRADLPWLAGMGALAVATFQVTWIFAVLINGPSLATIIQCNSPIIVTILARIIWREPLTWQKWTAIGLASLGTVLVAWPGDPNAMQLTLTGFLVSLGAAFSYAGITLFTKKLARAYESWTILAYAFAFAGLALLPFHVISGLDVGQSGLLPPFDRGQVVLTFAGFVLITTIGGYALYATGLRHLPASVASIAGMTEVPFAAALGYVFLGDRLGTLQIMGALIVVSGVVLLSLRREHPALVTRQPVDS